MEILHKFKQTQYLLSQLVRRDILLKYRGSILGIAWSFLYPIILLTAFTFVFGTVLNTKWNLKGSGIDLALFIYCGLIVFTPFAEVVSVTPRLIQSYQAYVKKIVFPTEILPLVTVFSATIHGLVNLIVLVSVATLAGYHNISKILFLPIFLLPAWMFVLGIAWFFTAIGVYVRDLIHVIPVFTQLVLFLSPVFYPIDAAPPVLRQICRFNPLAMAMENTRHAVLEGAAPDFGHWMIMFSACFFIAVTGYIFFRHCKEEFADAL